VSHLEGALWATSGLAARVGLAMVAPAKLAARVARSGEAAHELAERAAERLMAGPSGQSVLTGLAVAGLVVFGLAGLAVTAWAGLAGRAVSGLAALAALAGRAASGRAGRAGRTETARAARAAPPLNSAESLRLRAERLASRAPKVWNCFGRFLPAWSREKLFGPDLAEHACDLFVELAAAETRGRQNRLIVKFTAAAAVKVFNSIQVTARRRLRDEIEWVAGALTRK
jgi:hypothetical protein